MLLPKHLRVVALALMVTVSASRLLLADDIDWDKARQLYQKQQSGQTLTPDEQTYLDKAKAARAAAQRVPSPNDNQTAPAITNTAPNISSATSGRLPPADHTDLVPLTDLTGDYKGEDGGLYGKGQNTPPPDLAAAAKAQTATIQPLDGQGKPAPDGKIVLLSIGMSNTTGEFSTFIPLANADPAKSPKVVIVDGAQGGQSADKIATNEAPFWNIIEQRLSAAGVTPRQVQVIWLKEAIPQPKDGFPAEMNKLRDCLIDDLHVAQGRYPNLRIAYLSSRTYGGYATVSINPEPYAYETAFADRWVIEAQMKGDPKLNNDPTKGEVKAPLVLWGPYLWADGVKGRKIDGLVWNRVDFGPDGTHPTRPGGCEKVANLLLTFFKTDPNTQTWFLGK
jgi:hypothetical protein